VTRCAKKGESAKNCLRCIVLQRGPAAGSDAALFFFFSSSISIRSLGLDGTHLAHGLWCCFPSVFVLILMIRDCNCHWKWKWKRTSTELDKRDGEAGFFFENAISQDSWML
jgi:hypothetical protein